ncbi:MAG: ribosome biogenesis GTPase Der [Gammaproteobacteria bacterium]
MNLLPVIVIVGRPNVGKSTLFNRLTKTRKALVADLPGVTRDRIYGEAILKHRSVVLVDTGGLTGEHVGIEGKTASQAQLAIEEADVVLFMVDGSIGLQGSDEDIAQQLRRLSKPVVLAVNKTDGTDLQTTLLDFHSLALGTPIGIAAIRGRGIQHLKQMILDYLPAEKEQPVIENPPAAVNRIAIVGRPNVGKSTLINRLLGEERVIAHDMPGTTRDSVFIPFSRLDKEYIFVDTAGIRRRGKIKETIEKFSIVKAIQAIEAVNVVVLVMDAQEDIVEQDLRLLGFVIESGKSLVIVVNKWDNLATEQREKIKATLERRLAFIEYAELFFISALHGTGVGNLFPALDAAFDSAMREVSTAELNGLLAGFVAQQAPPIVRGRRIKLRYANPGGKNPPLIVIHGNQTESLPERYKRYLMNAFRKGLKLVGTPVRLQFKTSTNPFAGRRNKLTPRQERTHKRLLKRNSIKK